MSAVNLNIYFLSTLETNIGDEFIRDGLIAVIDSLRPEDSWTWKPFNKHQPWTFYPPMHPARLASVVDACFHRGWRRGLNALSSLPGNLFFHADLVIQSGTPVIWSGAHRSEWAQAFWKAFGEKNKGRIPLINVGGGSCYPWSDPPERLTGADREFARKMVECAQLTTTRDPLASHLLSEASGRDIPVIPCSAFLAGQFHAQVKEPDGRILFNVMPIGGHFDYLKQIHPEVWLSCAKQLISSIEGEYKVEFLCHNDEEERFAREHWPQHSIHRPKSPKAYFELSSGATAAVVNRLHAAVGLSGLGIPCIAVGTDTRMLMTQQLGIPTLFTPDASPNLLRDELTQLLQERSSRSRALVAKREQLLQQYQELLGPYLEIHA